MTGQLSTVNSQQSPSGWVTLIPQPSSLNSQPLSTLKVRASEQESSSLELLLRAQPKLNNTVVNSQTKFAGRREKQPSSLKVCASERDVSLLTNRSAPTRSISVGCDEENLVLPRSCDLSLISQSSTTQLLTLNSQPSTLNPHPSSLLLSWIFFTNFAEN